jgi:(hydroxyamino)benzene mutase
MHTQRSLFRHGFALMTLGFLLGGVVGAMGGGPRARLWLGAHVTGLLVGLVVIAVAAAWPHLSLGPGARRAAYAVTVYGNWTGAAVLGVFASAVGFPTKISTPELPPPPAWASAIVGVGLVVVTLSTFAMCGLVLYGLRGTGEKSTAGSAAGEPAPAE